MPPECPIFKETFFFQMDRFGYGDYEPPPMSVRRTGIVVASQTHFLGSMAPYVVLAQENANLVQLYSLLCFFRISVLKGYFCMVLHTHGQTSENSGWCFSENSSF